MCSKNCRSRGFNPLFIIAVLLFSAFVDINGQAACSTTNVITGKSFGTYFSTNFPNYPIGDNCGWQITVGTNNYIQLDLTVYFIYIDTHWGVLKVYDGPTISSPMLFTLNPFSANQYRISFVTSSNAVLVKFSTSNAGGNGFVFSFREMQLHLPHSFVNSSYSNWQVTLPYGGPVLRPNGTIRLVEAAPTQTGQMWAISQLALPDNFALRAKVTIGSNGTVGEGLAFFFVPSLSMSADSSFGIDWARFAGLAVFIRPIQNSIFARYYQNMTNIPNATECAGSIRTFYCNMYDGLRTTMDIMITVTSGTSLSVTFCLSGSPYCESAVGGFYDLVNPLSAVAALPLYFGIVANNSDTNYDYIDLISLQFLTPVNTPCLAINCPPNAYCQSNGTCACMYGWKNARCATPNCPQTCKNGGTCIAPSLCSCKTGWNDIKCSTAQCNGVKNITNSTAGQILSENYLSNGFYFYQSNCAWLITVPDGFYIQVTFTGSSMVPNGYDQVNFYDGSSSQDPLLYRFMGTTSVALTIVSTSSSFYIVFQSYPYYYGSVQAYYGFSIFYRQIALHPEWSFFNGSTDGWNVSLPYTGPTLQPDGTIQLAQAVPNKSGVMWNLNPLNVSDFAVNIVVRTSSSGITGGGIAAMFANSALMNGGFIQGSYTYGVNLTNFAGLIVKAAPMYKSMYAMYAQNTTSLSNTLCASATFHGTCNNIVFSNQFNLLVSVIRGVQFWVTFISNNSIVPYQYVFGNVYFNGVFSGITQPVYWGIGATNGPTSLDFFKIVEAKFFTPSFACSTPCANGDCIGDNLCSCYYLWTGPICDIPLCVATCFNGAVCVSPTKYGTASTHYCQCTSGWTGSSCTAAYCNYNSTLNATSGSFKSTGYPSAYLTNERCGWWLSTGPAKAIQLTVTVATFGAGDYLAIYDGSSSNSTMLFYSASSYYKIEITSSACDMFVWYYTDGSGTSVGTGFNATYQQVPSTGVVYGNVRNFYFPQPAPLNETVSWKLTVSSGLFAFELQTFNLSLGTAVVTVYDGFTNTPPYVIASVTIDNYHKAFIANRNYVLVTYSNWNYIQTSILLMFRQQAATVHCPQNSSLTATSSSGTLQTVNYGNGYYNRNETCQWAITADIGYAISLTVTANLMGVFGDYLYIYDGSAATGLLLMKTYASYYKASITSLSNSLYILFTSNNDFFVGTGFKISFQLVARPPSFSGSIQSLNWGTGSYYNNENEGWQINSPPWYFINFNLNSSTFDGVDYIDLFNGASSSNNTLIERSYGGVSNDNCTTNGSALFFTFITDSSNTGPSMSGYLLNYQGTPAQCSPSCLNGGTCIGWNVCGCTAGWTGSDCSIKYCITNSTTTGLSSGTVESDKDSAGNYFNNERCGWFISVSSDSSIQLNITCGTMDQGNDFLYIYDAGTSLIATISASYYFASFTTLSNSVFIYFVSDGNSRVGTGFSVDFQEVMSSGKINGFIENANYSAGGYYRNNQSEQWLISVRTGNVIWFTLQTPQNAFGDCVDALRLYNGQTTTASLMTKWCSSLSNQSFTSTSNNALVMFTTNANGVGHGFHLEFREGATIASCSALPSTITNHDSGLVMSENYPSGFYNNNETCFWTIVVPDGHSIWLEVTVSNLGVGDAVFIYDGSNAFPNALLANLSTSHFTGGFLTSANIALIVFNSDADYNVGNGFQVYFMQVLYVPIYSFNNGDISAWNVYLPYNGPSVQLNDAIRLVNSTTNSNGAMWTKALFNASDFVVNIAVTIGNSGSGGDGFGVFFVNNNSIVRPPGNSALGVDWANFAGLAVRESPSSSSTFITYSPIFSSVPRNNCSYPPNLPQNCGSSTALTQTFNLTVAVFNGSVITVTSCFPPSSGSFSPACSVILWNVPLSSSINLLPEPLIFGIGASNGATYNYVDIKSISFYSRANCSNGCSNNGTCIGQDVCYCSSGWTGPTCNSAICWNPCLNGATCTLAGYCSCVAGWNGTLCEFAICTNPCENDGNCTKPDTCSCSENWTGPTCNIPVCSPPCGTGGYCSSPNNCTCEDGWLGLLCDIANCSMPCLNNGTCAFPETCSCAIGWTGVSCELRSGNITADDLLAMTDSMLAANIPIVERAVSKIAADAAATGDTEIIIGVVTTIDDLLSRYANITIHRHFSPKSFADIARVCSEAADKMMFAVTNYTENESAVVLVESTIKCQIDDGNVVAAVAEPMPSVTRQRATKEQLRKMFSAFMKMLVNMFANLRNILPPGTNMTFGGQFYGAVVFNLRFGDLPGLTLKTSLADVTFQQAADPSELINPLPTGCSALDANSSIPIVLSAFIVNVNDVDVPFNMPTVAVRLYCQEQLELVLNPALPMLVVGIPSVHKALLFASQNRDAQCDVSQTFCNADNVATMGSLASFPLNLIAGDFVVIFPAIAYNFTARISFNTPPTRSRYHWLVNVTHDSVTIQQNGSFLANPRYFYHVGVDLRVIIPGSTLNQLASLLTRPISPVALYVQLKKDFSWFPSSGNLPASACDLQRCYGYHLKIGRAANSNSTKSVRVKRDMPSDTSNGFELEPESTESAVVFKSAYFGDYGADLVISPNTIQFSDIFANFSTLAAENSAVLSFQVTVVVFFLIGVIFAFQFDKTDLREWAYLRIISNQPYQKVNYLISLNCVRVRNFDLGPQISIRLIGNIHDTVWRLLEDGVRPRGFDGIRPANFILATQLSLGRIDAIELKVESRKISHTKRLQIHVDRVTVVEVDRGLKHIFAVKTTLQSGEAIRVALASEDELKGYTYLLTGHSRTSFTDIHPWLSVLQRPLPSSWTRTERLACVVSAVFMAMLVNSMFYGKEASAPSVGVSVGRWFTLSWFTIWTSFVGCVIVIPPTAVIGFIFKKVKRKSAVDSQWTTVFNLEVKTKEDPTFEENPDSKTKKKKKPLELPYYCVIFAWILVAACVGTSSFFVVMYSLSWGEAKSLQWLSGMVITIIQDILLIQPVKVLVMAILSATIHHLPDDGLDIGKLTYNINNNRRKTELFFRLRKKIVDVAHHSIYVVIFAAVIATMTNPYSYIQIKSLRPLVEIAEVEQIQDTVSHPAVYSWLQEHLIPNFLTGNQVEFGGRYKTAAILYKIQNPNVALLGPIRLRQQRVSQVVCPLNQSLARLMNGKFAPFLTSIGCQNDYSNTLGLGDSSERRAFNGSWSALMPQGLPVDLKNESLPWIYRDTEGAPYAGWEAVYFPGGYYVDLPRRKSSALATVASLMESRWIDNATSVLFVEFNLFNSQCNLFIPVRIVFESLTAGGMTYHVRMFPLQLYQYSGASSTLVYVLQAIWVIVLVTHVIQVIRRTRKERFAKLCRSGWNWLDLCQISLGLSVVLTFAIRIYFIITKLTQIQTMRTTYINLDLLVNWEDVLFDIFGVAFFLALFLFFRHLSINKQWAVLVATLSKGKVDVFSYVVMLGTVTILFAGVAYVVMGHTTWNFSSYSRAIFTLAESLLGSIDFSNIINNTFYMFLAMLYNTIVIFVGGYVFGTLLIAAHKVVISDAERQSNWDAELSNYMTNGIRDLMNFRKKSSHVKFLTNTNEQSVPKSKDFTPIGEKNFAELERVTMRLTDYADMVLVQDQGLFEKRGFGKVLWLNYFMDAYSRQDKRRPSHLVKKSLDVYSNESRSATKPSRQAMEKLNNSNEAVSSLPFGKVRESYTGETSNAELKPVSQTDHVQPRLPPKRIVGVKVKRKAN